jgi:hypothetical protein
MEMTTLDELERLLKAGTKGPWETKQNKAGNTTIGPVGYSGFITPWVCDDENAALIVAAINALPGLIESARRVRELQAENADLKTSVIAFAGPAAVRYAADFAMPEGHLAAHHYDLLEKCGARMTDFTRAALKGT